MSKNKSWMIESECPDGGEEFDLDGLTHDQIAMLFKDKMESFFSVTLTSPSDKTLYVNANAEENFAEVYFTPKKLSENDDWRIHSLLARNPHHSDDQKVWG